MAVEAGPVRQVEEVVMAVPERGVGDDVVGLPVGLVVDDHREQVEAVLVHEPSGDRLAVRRPHRHRGPRRAAPRQDPVQGGGEPAGGGDRDQRAVGPGAEGERAAVGDDDGPAHAGLTCVFTRAAAASTGDALERRPQHVDRLGAQLVQGPVAVDAFAEVDLGERIRSEMLRHVDQKAELHPVAAGEAQLLEDPAVRRRLAGQRLAHPRELGEEQLEHGPGHQLGDPAAAGGVTVQRPRVEALDQRDMVGGQQRAEEPGHEGRGRVGDVRVQEGDDVTRRGRQRRRHRLALAAVPTGSGHHGRPGVAGLLGGVVERAVIEHDDLVDQPVAPVPGQEGLHHRPHDRPHRRALVAGRDAHRDCPPGPGLGLEHRAGGEVPVVIGLGHALDSSSRAALRWPAPAGYHGRHHPERLRDGPVDVAATSAEHLVPMPDR